jgi:ATP-dependent Clp protease ATP-binding subunit ClpB
MNSAANFTHKAQEAILFAQDLAREKGQQQIDALHLLVSLLSQEKSLVLNLLERLGVDVEVLKRKASAALTKLPVVSSPQAFGQFYLTQDMAKVLDVAREEANKMGDEFISVEHLFLALMSTNTKAREILEKAEFTRAEGGFPAAAEGNIDYENVLKELAKIRGGQRITDPEPESKYQVIEKYTDHHGQAGENGSGDRPG